MKRRQKKAFARKTRNFIAIIFALIFSKIGIATLATSAVIGWSIWSLVQEKDVSYLYAIQSTVR